MQVLVFVDVRGAIQLAYIKLAVTYETHMSVHWSRVLVYTSFVGICVVVHILAFVFVYTDRCGL